MQKNMKPYSVLLFILVWMQTGNLVRAQDCHLASFLSSDHYDSNLDTSGLKDSYILGSQVRVPCHVGYVGSFKLLCLSDVGVRWVPQGSKCELKSCGHPGDAEFADFNLVEGEDFVFGSEVEYTCQTGYQMVSRINKRRCMHSGWDGHLPVCEAKQCPAIHVENDMQVTGEHLEASYGHVLRFRCKQNHLEVNGTKQIYCDENGEWSAPTPTCKERTCGPPGDVQFAKFNLTKGQTKGEDYVLDSEVKYTCQTGFKMVYGVSINRCTLNGWDGVIPTCESKSIQSTLRPYACSSYLGIKNDLVPDDSMTASSVYGSWGKTKWEPYFGRLDEAGIKNAWSADTNDRSQWLQVDLGWSMTITGIITQGGGRGFTPNYVKSFKVSHSDDGRSWTVITDANGSDKIFNGNCDKNTHKENMFESLITSRYVRVLPWTWKEHITMRIELLGCVATP